MAASFRFLVCDDDDRFCQREKRFISDFYRKMGIEAEIAVFHSGGEIIALGENAAGYDAIFLDVGMEQANGIDFGAWLGAAFPRMMIVLLSGCISYAPDGYRVGAVRYIVKDEGRFEESMGECLTYIARKLREDDAELIPIDGGKLRVSVGKILYVDSAAHRVTFHLMENGDTQTEYTVYGKLDDIERELADFGFCRIHQSYLVNMNYVRDVRRYQAVFLNGMEIQISKKRYKTAQEAFVRVRGTF